MDVRPSDDDQEQHFRLTSPPPHHPDETRMNTRTTVYTTLACLQYVWINVSTISPSLCSLDPGSGSGHTDASIARFAGQPTCSRPVPFGREAGTEWSDDLNSPPADGGSWGIVSSVESLVASSLGVVLVLVLVLMLVVLVLVRLLSLDFLRFVFFEAFESFASNFFSGCCCIFKCFRRALSFSLLV